MRLAGLVILFFCSFMSYADEQSASGVSTELNIPSLDDIRKSIPTQDSPALSAERNRHSARIDRLKKLQDQEMVRHENDLKSLTDKNVNALFMTQESQRHEAMTTQYLIAISVENRRFRKNLIKFGVPEDAVVLMMSH